MIKELSNKWMGVIYISKQKFIYKIEWIKIDFEKSLIGQD